MPHHDTPPRPWFSRLRRHEHGLPGPPPTPPRHPRLHAEFEVATLRELIAAGSASAAEVGLLARQAASLAPDGWLATFLREQCSGLPSELALDLAAASLRAELHRRLAEAAVATPDHVAVVIPPLPPHVLAKLLARDSVVVVDLGHPLPPHFRHDARITWITDPMAQRAVVSTAGIIAFDAAVAAGVTYVRVPVAQLIDERLVRADSRLLVHYRPRRELEDVPLPAAVAARLLRI